MKMLRSFFAALKELEYWPVFIGAILLGFAGWQNMYPLVFPDTGTYVVTGLEGRVPVDRPLLYGLFLRHTSMRATMWLAMIAQTLLVSGVLFAFIKTYFRAKNYTLIFYFLLTVLIGCTAISIKTCTLIPDIFTPLPILIFFILLHKPTRILRWWYSVVMVLSIAVHQSHLMMLVVTFMMLAVYEFFTRGYKSVLADARKMIFLLPVMVASFFITPVINLIYSGSFYWSKGGGIFMMGRLVDNGMLQTYLNESCDKLPLEICQYKEKIPGDFLWDQTSPLYKMGGWEHPSPEFDMIARNIITTPRYFLPLAYKTISATAVQFFTYNISLRAENEPMGFDSPPHYALRHVYKREINNYTGSNQNVGRLNYDAIDGRQTWMLIIVSALFILIKASSLRRYAQTFNRVFLLILFYTISNAFICGALSIPNPRYQTRVFWLLPMMMMLVIIQLIADHREEITAWLKGKKFNA